MVFLTKDERRRTAVIRLPPYADGIYIGGSEAIIAYDSAHPFCSTMRMYTGLEFSALRFFFTRRTKKNLHEEGWHHAAIRPKRAEVQAKLPFA